MATDVSLSVCTAPYINDISEDVCTQHEHSYHSDHHIRITASVLSCPLIYTISLKEKTCG
jgi:hypothetical protein